MPVSGVLEAGISGRDVAEIFTRFRLTPNALEIEEGYKIFYPSCLEFYENLLSLRTSFKKFSLRTSFTIPPHFGTGITY